ncbi:MAG: YceI family protein [Bacteroidota bacterium]
MAQSLDVASSKVEFRIKNFGFWVDGTLGEPEIEGEFRAEAVESSRFSVTIPVKTIDTGNNARDKHLLKEDYFYVEKYPEIKFETTNIRKSKSGYEALGKLTIRGIEKEMVLPFTVSSNGGSYELVGNLSLDRRTFDVGGNSMVLGDTVEVTITVVL